jgi:hypothetical protein
MLTRPLNGGNSKCWARTPNAAFATYWFGVLVGWAGMAILS